MSVVVAPVRFTQVGRSFNFGTVTATLITGSPRCCRVIVPSYTDGEPDEALLAAAGAFELEAFGPGPSCNATYELAAGKYILFCIVRTDDGQTHYDKEMKSTLLVT